MKAAKSTNGVGVACANRQENKFIYISGLKGKLNVMRGNPRVLAVQREGGGAGDLTIPSPSRG